MARIADRAHGLRAGCPGTGPAPAPPAAPRRPRASQRPRGSQYVSLYCTERLAQAGIEPSVGSVGDGYDNTLAESINGLYKADVIDGRGP